MKLKRLALIPAALIFGLASNTYAKDLINNDSNFFACISNNAFYLYRSVSGCKKNCLSLSIRDFEPDSYKIIDPNSCQQTMTPDFLS